MRRLTVVLIAGAGVAALAWYRQRQIARSEQELAFSGDRPPGS